MGRARRDGNPIGLRRACLALHAPRSVVLADFFSILFRIISCPRRAEESGDFSVMGQWKELSTAKPALSPAIS